MKGRHFVTKMIYYNSNIAVQLWRNNYPTLSAMQ